MFLLWFITAIIAALIVGAIMYARWNYGELEAAGIPTETPKFILGSDPKMHDKVWHHEDIRRFKKYGPVWGVYEGRTPAVFVADAELARQILIKDFETFRDRRSDLDFGHELVNEMLDILPYHKWKAVRTALSPAFTTGKIRHMSNEIEDAVRDCVAHINQELGEEDKMDLDVKKIFSALTTDVLARCVFGTKLNNVNDPSNKFVQAVNDLAGDGDDAPANFSLLFTFPILAKGQTLFPTKVIDFFAGILRDIMKTRRDNNITKGDLVDTFNELIAKAETPEFKELGITEITIMCQALLFLIAGYDTTATTLTMLSYHLANNPDKQKKLIEELGEFMETTEGKLTHDNLSNLPYMDACINETLRISAPFYRSERVCQKDWESKEFGLKIKKGWTVFVASHALHRNEKYWSDPEAYIPERFLPENKDKLNPYAFNAFGQGPRNCVGSRFAKEELVYALALLLKDFTFEPVLDTNIEYKKGRMFLVNYYPFQVTIARTRRNKQP